MPFYHCVSTTTTDDPKKEQRSTDRLVCMGHRFSHRVKIIIYNGVKNDRSFSCISLLCLLFCQDDHHSRKDFEKQGGCSKTTKSVINCWLIPSRYYHLQISSSTSVSNIYVATLAAVCSCLLHESCII